MTDLFLGSIYKVVIKKLYRYVNLLVVTPFYQLNLNVRYSFLRYELKNVKRGCMVTGGIRNFQIATVTFPIAKLSVQWKNIDGVQMMYVAQRMAMSYTCIEQYCKKRKSTKMREKKMFYLDYKFCTLFYKCFPDLQRRANHYRRANGC